MSSDVQGRALAVLNRVAQADWPDRLKLRKPFEKLIYTGSRASFRAAAQRAGKVAKLPRPVDPDALFDLSLSDEQQMLEAFASEVLRPLAHGKRSIDPTSLWRGFAFYSGVVGWQFQGSSAS